MGRRGYVQVKHAEYGDTCFSDWAQSAAAEWLEENGINICTPEDCVSNDADHWEIEIPCKLAEENRRIGYVTDYDHIQKVIDRLREHPDALDEYLDEDCRDREFGYDLACLLDEGLKSAKKNGYSWINIDWF